MLSPHIGGVTGDAYVNMGVAAARNALAVLAGDDQRHVTTLQFTSGCRPGTGT